MCGKSKNSGQVLLSIGQVCVSTVVNLADSFALGGRGRLVIVSLKVHIQTSQCRTALSLPDSYLVRGDKPEKRLYKMLAVIDP